MTFPLSGTYAGNLKVDLSHHLSQTSLTTAASIEDQGDGSSFSPTDLVAVALGSCILTVLGIVAARHQINLEGTQFTAEKQMSNEPRRIGKIVLNFEMPAGLAPKKRKLLEHSAHACPVSKSLHPDLEKEFRFHYPD